MLTLLYAGVMLATGCNRLPEGEAIAEVNEPGYEEGKRLLRQGNEQGALAAFSHVIELRKDGAPESHLEVGLLYQLEIKDPIAAIYHFRRYLELKPNAPQADLVRQRIDAATRDFARTLPAQPLENQVMRNDMLDVVEQLRNENTRLKDEISALRANTALNGTAAARRPANGSGLSGQPDPYRIPIPVAESGIVSAPLESPPVRSSLTAAATTPTRPTTAPAAGARVHVVVKGDTLYGLARKYFNNAGRAKDIFAANRDKMKSESDLQIGMELVIPQ